MRQKILVANWKMNVSDLGKAEELVSSLPTVEQGAKEGTRVIICPPFVWLQSLSAKVAAKGFELGAQNCAGNKEGPHTGEVSAGMLASIGCKWVILGHSERRREQNEDDELLIAKLKLAASAELRVILCVGEAEGEDPESALAAQLSGILVKNVRPAAVAYEPVWAIGSGKTPAPSQIASAHGVVRRLLGEEDTLILYGGSVDDGNITQLAAVAECDGFLVGGASISDKKFGKMIAVLGKIG